MRRRRYSRVMSTAPNTVRMRTADIDDAAMLLDWRNDPVTREMSLQSDVVPLTQHLRWMASSLASDHRVLLIAEDPTTAEPVGMCRFDLEGRPPVAAEVSINLAPPHRGRGLGVAVLSGGIRELARTHPEVRILTAVIRAGNAASIRLFASAGFASTSAADDVLTYTLGADA